MTQELRPIAHRPTPAPQVWPGPAPYVAANDDPGGFWDIAVKLWRHKWLVVGVTAGFVVVAAIASTLMTPRYATESQVLVGVQSPRVLSAESILNGLTANSETVQSEAYIITSRATAERVAKRLQLDTVPEFNAALRPKPLFSLSSIPGYDVVKNWLSDTTQDAQAATPSSMLSPEERKWSRVTSSLLGHVQVTPLNRSHILSIEAESENPQLAARVANTFAEVYIEQQMSTKQTAASEADRWLEGRIAKLREQVEKSDQAVEEHRRKYGLYETRSDTVVAQQLAELNRELLVAQNAMVDAQTRYQQASSQLKGTNSLESLPAVLQSPLIQTLRGQQSQLEQRSAQLASSYTDKHPIRRDIAAQIKEIEGKIRGEAQRIIDSLAHQTQMAQDRYNRVKKQMVELETRMARSNEESIPLRQLEREAQANRDMLVALLQRSKETVDQQSLMTADARITSRADVPLSPSFPPSGLILILAAFAGLGGGTLLALFLEGTDQTYRTDEDVETDTGLPVLAVVPNEPRNGRDADNPRASYWESLQMLHTRLSLQAKNGEVPESVLFTSAVPGEGKTSLATAYARLLALEGHRVVLLELDWKNPSLHKALGQPQQAGLAELLHGFVTPEESVYRDGETGLHAIFAGNGEHISQSGVWLARLRLLIGTLSHHYDVIVLDSAPASITPEVLHVSRLVEQSVFVVKWSSTPRRAVQAGLRNLQHAGAAIAGVVFSQVNLDRYHRHANRKGDYRYRQHLAYDVG